ncbi:MAG: tetratricopeptide repeat protein [Candidatus Falkowbacteria bacterium]|nr:tetratricopeptide repeat protein [Candidatus Falkowbacteria bacterium]
MEYIIAWSVFLVAVVVIFVIIARKAGLLANIDVDQVAGERARILKQQIIADRLRRRFGKWGFWTVKLVKPISKLLRNGFDYVYDSLNAWQRSQVNRQAVLNQEIDKRIETLLVEAEELTKSERFDAAEKKYIEIIGLDPRNFTAFNELGYVYYKKQSFNEARQTLEYALSLRRKSSSLAKKEGEPTPKDLEIAQVNYLLGMVFEEIGDLNRAIISLKRALKIENNNPRYLDRLIEVSIIKKDKISALDTLKRLEMVNPENQKLDQFRQRIAEL